MSIYKYNLYVFPNGAIRAYIPVYIENPIIMRGEASFCLVDTGADVCMINSGLAINLGHDLKANGVQSSAKLGIKEEKVTTWLHTFKLHLLDPGLKSVIWASKEMLFECVESSKLPVLIGVKDFLSNFKVTFDYPNGMFLIEL